MSFVTNPLRSVPLQSEAAHANRVVQLSELSEAWESGEDVDLVGQYDSWGEDSHAEMVAFAPYVEEVRAAG
jgi:hypothetical protein